MAFLIAGALLVAFIGNVVLGATTGNAIVGNVGEMLILFAASIAFVIAVLQREAAEKATRDTNT